MSKPALQEELERYSGRLIDRLTQIMEPLLESHEHRVRRTAVHRLLRYVAAVLDIASGPVPEVNLLDLLVLVKLARAALARRASRAGLGPVRAELDDAFATAERDLAQLSEQASAPLRPAELDELVKTWLAEHPSQHRVEGVRLGNLAGTGRSGTERAAQIGGLLSSLGSAAASADRALLVAERGFFLVHRLPFVLRLQARLAAAEAIEDALHALASLAARGTALALLLVGGTLLLRRAARAR
jgi:hypothetical protein